MFSRRHLHCPGVRHENASNVQFEIGYHLHPYAECTPDWCLDQGGQASGVKPPLQRSCPINFPGSSRRFRPGLKLRAVLLGRIAASAYSMQTTCTSSVCHVAYLGILLHPNPAKTNPHDGPARGLASPASSGCGWPLFHPAHQSVSTVCVAKGYTLVCQGTSILCL